MPHKIEDVNIEPKLEALDSLDVSSEDFYQALERALDCLEGMPMDELPRPSNISITVRGQVRQLGELARIAVSLNCGQAAVGA
jgi:hypothetical protein